VKIVKNERDPRVLFIVVCPFVLFLLAIVLSVLLFTASDYPFGIYIYYTPTTKGDILVSEEKTFKQFSHRVLC
jgi:hypothetical protein